MNSMPRTITALLTAFAAIGASAQVDGGRLQRVPIPELKRVYLSCVDASARDRLDHGSIVLCSIAYEELKRRAFDNDFDKILAWSRAQVPIAGSAAGAPKKALP